MPIHPTPPLPHYSHTTNPPPLSPTEGGPSFEVAIPKYRNRVDLYLDPERKAGFIVSIDLLQKLGYKTYVKRWLWGYSYQGAGEDSLRVIFLRTLGATVTLV